jgi:Protein of unknown function (DUF3109)
VIQHGNTLISDDVLSEFFTCDIRKCKGACCVEGDKGAPLEVEEIQQINHNLNPILNELDDEHRTFIEENGFYEKDDDGELVTKCLDNGQCCFVKEGANGILGCGMENAYYQKTSAFVKPISCHLYPIRIKQTKEFTFLNYHQWYLCNDACPKGTQDGTKVYEFVGNALIRKFGEQWYQELEEIDKARSQL